MENPRFKFRVWDKKEKRFIDHPQINPLFGCVCGYENSTYPLQIEQCTGLKDNCGNLIYEGDVIGDGEDDFVIKWDNNRTKFVAEDNDTSYEVEDVLDPTICVIGNIHEQAEQKD